jgi:hypothetical protein
MLRLLDSKTRIFCPSEAKTARFQASLSSPAERNRAPSAFKRFFPPKSLRRAWVLILLGQSLRVFDAPSQIFSTVVITVYWILPQMEPEPLV